VPLGERAETLARDIIGPLLVGGPVILQRPFGAKLALSLGEQRQIVDNDLRRRVDEARLRVARQLVAVDVLVELGPAEWAMAAGLNDLLQATNHELSSFATRGRHGELLEAVDDLCARIPRCHNLQDAVARHATFSRALELTRFDSTVSWWTGSQAFRGQSPPARLMAWPGLRRVHTDRRAITLMDMDEGVPLEPGRFETTLNHWLACSPLTDLANAARPVPRFVWSPRSLHLVSTVAGQNLALRAFARVTQFDDTLVKTAVGALNESASQLRAGGKEQAAAVHFATQLAAADSYFNQVG
jgi:hypothetical protein